MNAQKGRRYGQVVTITLAPRLSVRSSAILRQKLSAQRWSESEQSRDGIAVNMLPLYMARSTGGSGWVDNDGGAGSSESQSLDWLQAAAASCISTSIL
jgi:hypothetical protein